MLLDPPVFPGYTLKAQFASYSVNLTHTAANYDQNKIFSLA